MTFESSHHSSIPPKSRLLYIVCGLFCGGMIVLLPLVEVDIIVRTPAMIRPSAQITIIHTIQSGRVSQSFLSENKYVRQGSPLIILESEVLAEKEEHDIEKLQWRQAAIQDLRMIARAARRLDSTRVDTLALPKMHTRLYRQQYISYRERLLESFSRCQKAHFDFERNLKLFKQQVIPTSEFENYQYQLQQEQSAARQITEDQLAQWSHASRILLEEIAEIESQLSITHKEKLTLTINAPVNGSIQNLAAVYPGSYVYANQELAQISPDTTLVVIAYVPPSDIGFIHHNMPVRMQVNAFNYNQWGMVSGRVLEVPQDIKIIDSKPVFEVRCSLDKTFLQLKNGYKGFLKKGMTLQAGFIITRRSLWQLLYDKVDHWVNPSL